MPEDCNLLKVNFNVDAYGNVVEPGTYPREEWLPFGFELFAEGGVGTLPRIFDSTNPGTVQEGDPDLGAPNKACPGGGPGHGVGGEPGKRGMNCERRGNVLIIQEPNNKPDIPDDNVDGGMITLDFPYPGGQYVKEIGLLDADYGARIIVGYETETGYKERELVAELLGDNSFQIVEIDQANVTEIRVILVRSGGITDITFCPRPHHY